MDEYCHGNYHSPFFWNRHSWRRRFLSDEEKKELKKQCKERKIEWLKRYKESLENELMGLNERLEKLMKKE